MVEKIRFGGEWGTKKIVAVVLFAMIIVTFVLVGPRYGGGGEDTGSGVAALVNDVVISTAEFRQRAEQVEQGTRRRFEGLPEAQRRMISAQMRRNELERLIAAEAVYQAAAARGVRASDAEVKAQLLQIPVLNENGRFQGDRYRALLEQQNLSAEDFERRFRKDIVLQKVFSLFAGAARPAAAEGRRRRELEAERLKVRYATLDRDALKKLGTVGEVEVKEFIAGKAGEIEAYYKDNEIEFTKPDSFRAHDLVVRGAGKRGDPEAMAKIAAIRRDLTPANFAKVARAESEDPGTRAKGGDLGEIPRGRLDPAFDAAVAGLRPGQISDPAKIGTDYHLIWLESRTKGGTQSLEDARPEVARRLLARAKEGETLAKLNRTVEKGETREIEALVARSGVKWEEPPEINLAATTLPKLGDAKSLIAEFVKVGRRGGFVRHVIDTSGNHVIASVGAWRTVKVEAEASADPLRAEPMIEAWAKDVQAKASVQRNGQLLK